MTTLRSEQPLTRRPLAASLLVLALFGACKTTASEAEPEASPRTIELADRRLTPEFQPALQAIAAALDSQDNVLARRILNRVLARGPSGDDRELALVFESILDGRDVLDQIDLRLKSTPVEGEPGAFQLDLVALQQNAQALTLRLPPGTLKRHQMAVAPEGAVAGIRDGEPVYRATEFEGRTMESHSVEGLETLELEPYVERRVPLCRYNIPVGPSLAVRDRWTLLLRSGEIEIDGRMLPAQSPFVLPSERIALAPYLPTDPVGPEVFVEYALRPQIRPAALMERAVRIPARRWDEALGLLASQLDGLSDERLAELSPALRWLARTARPGGDGKAWRLRLQAGSQVALAAAEADARGNGGGRGMRNEPVSAVDLPSASR